MTASTPGSFPYGTGRPENCPSCKSGNIHRAEEDRGYARRLRREQGRCCRGTQQNNNGREVIPKPYDIREV